MKIRKHMIKIVLFLVFLGVALGFNASFNLSQEAGVEQVIKRITAEDSQLYGYFKKIYWKNIAKGNRTAKQTAVDGNDVTRFIAHAGGGIDGHHYTNSLEALNLNYLKGFKYFELDIIRTSDNIYVASHDWKKWSMQTGYAGKIPPDLQTFKSHRILGKYTTMDINDINQWFFTHPDAVLITDKVNDPENFSKQFMFKDRLIMEVFSLEKMKEGLSENIKAIMPNWYVVAQFKGSKVDKLLSFGITSVAASRSVVRNHLHLVNELSHHGIRVYIYNVNKKNENNEIAVVCNDMKYIYGLYADQWDFRHEARNGMSCI